MEIDWSAVKVRHVSLEDAEFILRLRGSEAAINHLSQTQLNLDSQIKFLKLYLKRHKEGRDYYFIYSYKGLDFGVNRIYNVSKNFATSGSWVCLENTDVRLVLYSYYYMRKFFFESLNLKFDIMDTRTNNKNVLKLHKIFGATHLGIFEEDSFDIVTKEHYYKSKMKFEKIIFG